MPLSPTSLIAVLGALATTALGHGFVTGFIAGGEWHQGFLMDYYYEKNSGGTYPDIAAWYTEAEDTGYVAPGAYQTADINCHRGAAPGALTVAVPAGSTVQFQWGPPDHVWPHSMGPILDYLAACDGDCSAADKTQLRWVKIQERGIDYDTQVWASGDLIANNSTWTTTIPASIAPGDYVLRHEIIALHLAKSPNGAQNYPQCFNIRVTGSGTARPEGVLGTDLYRNTDPGLHFNPYVTITDYPMPGPTLFSG